MTSYKLLNQQKKTKYFFHKIYACHTKISTLNMYFILLVARKPIILKNIHSIQQYSSNNFINLYLKISLFNNSNHNTSLGHSTMLVTKNHTKAIHSK